VVGVKRRAAVVSVALLCAALLLHERVSQALVSRGDAFLYRGRLDTAQTFYERALLLTPRFPPAVDRELFTALQRGDPRALARAARIADEAEARVPVPERLHVNHALALEHLGRFTEAERDFARAGAAERSAILMTLAGWSARHAGRRADARRYWRTALAFDRRYAAARRALVLK
jgi:tetratricopeptide (TPR) repeat protein